MIPLNFCMTFIYVKRMPGSHISAWKYPAVPGGSKYPIFSFFEITSQTIGGYYRWINEVSGHILFGSHGSTLGSSLGSSLGPILL